MTELELASSIGAVIALVVGVIALKQGFNNRNREHVVVNGKIVGFVKRRNRNGTYFYPVFEYYFNGQTYSVESNIGSSTIKKGKLMPMSKYKEGDEIEIRVFPDEPSRGIINTSANVNLPIYVGSMAIGICVLFSAIAICLFMQ